MLEEFRDPNYYETLVYKTSMQPFCTYNSLKKVCENLTAMHIPFDVFKIIWNNISVNDRGIYHENEIDNIVVDNMYTDFIYKGSYKYSKNNKKTVKMKRALRYKFDDE